MRKLFALLCAACLSLTGTVYAQNQTPPSRELRSAWVATVWRLDWPQTLISETGNQSQIDKQKKQMTQMLDSLQLNNFNAINFQVRSRADAFYKSSYEPWSSDLVDSRGKDPGWDPLEFVVAECHKRGLECHAWVNPYRFESVTGAWNGTPNNIRDTHPDWIIDVNNASIFNPGLPEVTQYICDIIKEIVEKYDVDGVLFDDYFYLSGTNRTHDGALYDAYVADGGTKDIYDWRRMNVNNMIASVYSTIKTAKPWVRFGVSPAGIACTNSVVAASYGIPRCPVGSDWQYNDIYSDPIAWISQQNLDFISPQVYWTIGSSTSYDKATEWWSMVANKWGRHLFVSHSISSLTGSSRSRAVSGVEQNVMAADPVGPDYASGPGSGTFQEYVDEINLNRAYTLNNAPGSIFYSAKYLYRIAPLFSHYLRKHAFTTHCLPPAMPWMGAPVPEPVEGLSLAGSKLSWNAVDNMRYTVYAYPEGMSDREKVRMPEYLLGISYEPEYTIDNAHLSGYTFGVCAFDRYGNESSLAIPGQPAGQLTVPVPTSPVGNETVEAPFDFTWTASEGASEYIVEIARDAAMTERLDQRTSMSASISSEQFVLLPLDETLYWRVRACSPGYRDGVSEPTAFTVSQLRISSPASGVETESLTPTFTYSIDGREVSLDIATHSEFGDNEMVYTSTHTGPHTVADYALAGGVRYYARARYMRGTDALVSPTIEFTTPYAVPSVPSIASPLPGADLYADQHISVAPIAGPSVIRVEVSATENFPVRSSYFNNKVSTQNMTDPKSASEIRISNKPLVDGQTYWCRARASFLGEGNELIQTEYSAAVPFVFRDSQSGVTDAAVASAAVRIEGRTIVALADLSSIVLVDAAGISHPVPAEMSAGSTHTADIATGVYILSADGIEPIRFIVR